MQKELELFAKKVFEACEGTFAKWMMVLINAVAVLFILVTIASLWGDNINSKGLSLLKNASAAPLFELIVLLSGAGVYFITAKLGRVGAATITGMNIIAAVIAFHTMLFGGDLGAVLFATSITVAAVLGHGAAICVPYITTWWWPPEKESEQYRHHPTIGR